MTDFPSKYEKYKSKYLDVSDISIQITHITIIKDALSMLIDIAHDPIKINEILLDSIKDKVINEKNPEKNKLMLKFQNVVEKNLSEVKTKSKAFYKCYIDEIISKALDSPKIKEIDKDGILTKHYNTINNLNRSDLLDLYIENLELDNKNNFISNNDGKQILEGGSFDDFLNFLMDVFGGRIPYDADETFFDDDREPHEIIRENVGNFFEKNKDVALVNLTHNILINVKNKIAPVYELVETPTIRNISILFFSAILPFILSIMISGYLPYNLLAIGINDILSCMFNDYIFLIRWTVGPICLFLNFIFKSSLDYIIGFIIYKLLVKKPYRFIMIKILKMFGKEDLLDEGILNTFTGCPINFFYLTKGTPLPCVTRVSGIPVIRQLMNVYIPVLNPIPLIKGTAVVEGINLGIKMISNKNEKRKENLRIENDKEK